MSSLTPADIKQISDIIEKTSTKGKGFVWDFTNDDFRTFILSCTGEDIYRKKYSEYGNSKNKRLKKFLEIEDDIKVKNILEELKKYGISKRKLNKTNKGKFEKWIKKLNSSDIELQINDETFKSNKNVNLFIEDIHQCMNNNNLCMAIDRLHALFSGYIRYKANKNKIESTNKPLNSLYSEYINKLYLEGKLPEGITKTILTTSKKIMKDFDYVRNNMSPAHFNDIISNEEAKFVCNHVINILNFLTSMSKKRK